MTIILDRTLLASLYFTLVICQYYVLAVRIRGSAASVVPIPYIIKVTKFNNETVIALIIIFLCSSFNSSFTRPFFATATVSSHRPGRGLGGSATWAIVLAGVCVFIVNPQQQQQLCVPVWPFVCRVLEYSTSSVSCRKRRDPCTSFLAQDLGYAH